MNDEESIIGHILEAIEDPTAWNRVVQGLSRMLGAHAGWLMQPGADGARVFANHDVPVEVLDAYGKHYHSVDITIQAVNKRFPDWSFGPLRERDMVGERLWLNSEIYNDLGRPNNIGGILTASLGIATPNPPPVLSFFCPPGAKTFSSSDVRTYNRFLPNLRRAVRLRTILAGSLGPSLPLSVTLLDHLSHGVVLLSATGQVLHANMPARALLDRRDGLLLQAKRLTAAHRDQATRLEAMLAACVSAKPTGGEILIDRADGSSFICTAIPLPAHSAGPMGEEQCRACVAIVDTAHSSPDLASRLIKLFGLSPGEARVAAALARGLSPTEIADLHEVRLATIRSQSKAVYSKLAVNRQAELLRLLMTISGTLVVDFPKK